MTNSGQVNRGLRDSTDDWGVHAPSRVLISASPISQSLAVKIGPPTR